MSDRTRVLTHALGDMARDDMWFVAVCDCGWEGPPSPDPVTASNFWGQHLLALGQGGYWQDRALQVVHLHATDGADSPFCVECGHGWPCRTQRILHGEDDHQRVPATEHTDG